MKADAEKLVRHLAELADDIQLCRTKRMLTDFYEGGGIGREICDFLKTYKSNDHAEEQILGFIMQRIKEEFDECIYRDYNSGIDNILYLPKVIKWCLEKNFMQQALTLCSERIPEYLFVSGKLQLSDEFQQLLDEAKTGDYEKSYYFLAHLRAEFLGEMTNVKANTVLRSVRVFRRHLSDDELREYSFKTKLQWQIGGDPGVLVIAEKVSALSSGIDAEVRRGVSGVHLRNLFTRYGLSGDDINKIVKVSNQKKSTILGILQGKSFVKGSDALEVNLQLSRPEVRILKVLPELAKLFIESQTDESSYNQIINTLYAKEANEFAENLKSKYSQEQSNKFCVKAALAAGHITTNLQGNNLQGQEQLQRILYLFSLCKEQRNFSNHAYVSEDDTSVAMNSTQLNTLINALLDALE